MHKVRMNEAKVTLTATFYNFEEVDGSISELICTDEQRVMQVLHNFVSNAIKFTVEGEIHIHVELLKEGVPYLKVSVSDTGIGIKEEDQQKLFQLFGFIQSTQTMNTKGIGLGLAIC